MTERKTPRFAPGWYGGPDGEFRWWDGEDWVEADDTPFEPAVAEPALVVVERPVRPAPIELRADARGAGYDIDPGARVTFLGLPVPGAPAGPPAMDLAKVQVDESLEEPAVVVPQLRSAERYRLAGLAAFVAGAGLAFGGALLSAPMAGAGGAVAGVAGVLLGRSASRAGRSER